MSEKAREIRRCKADRRDGQPCQAFACWGDDRCIPGMVGPGGPSRSATVWPTTGLIDPEGVCVSGPIHPG